MLGKNPRSYSLYFGFEYLISGPKNIGTFEKGAPGAGNFVRAGLERSPVR